MSNLAQDLRFGLRLLRRSPAFTSVAVLSLALGIGANTAIFSVMDALVLRTLPVQHPEQLALLGDARLSGIYNAFPNGRNTDLYSMPFYQQLRTANTGFSDVAAIESMQAEPQGRFSGGNNGLERVKLRLVSGSYFNVLGVAPSRGRVLNADDDGEPGGHPLLVLSYSYWERRFAKDPAVIGRTLTFNSTVFTVVGVAARGFTGTVVGESPDGWTPVSMLAKVMPWVGEPWDGLSQSLWIMGRLRPGVSMLEAQTNANVIFQQWLHQFAGEAPSAEKVADMAKAHFPLTSAAAGSSELRRNYTQPLRILMVLVGVVLLIACANIANLLLARSSSRKREIAVRLALGAPRRRLVVQLVSESLLLSLTGGALGILLAWWGGQLLLSLVSSEQIPLEVGPNAHVLLFTLGLSLITGLMFGTLPALRMTRVDLGPSLKEGKGTARAQSRSRIGQALVVAQVALALFLTIGAGLFIGTLRSLEKTNAGFDRDHVVVLGLETDWIAFKREAWLSLCHRVESRVRALPGVESTAFAMLTYNAGSWRVPIWPQGVEHTRANQLGYAGNRVSADYFRTMGMSMLAGRTFARQDTVQSQHVAVINATFAKKVFGSESAALGKHFSMAGRDKYDFEIVGVVKDAHYDNLREKPQAVWFVSTEQDPELAETLVVRTTGNPTPVMAQLRAAVRAEDPNLTVSNMSTLNTMVEDSLSTEGLLAKLAAFFGALALLLSAIGLYGVMAYTVARRTNEIGIRMALGAQPGSVLRMMVGESLVLTSLGLMAGIAAALACGRYISSQLYGVAPTDPWIIAIAAAVLLSIALLASALPARRAALIDPLQALREE